MAKHLSSIGRHINLIIKSKLSLSIFCTLCIIITYFLRVCNIHTMPKSLTSLTLKGMRQIKLVKASTSTMICTDAKLRFLASNLCLSVLAKSLSNMNNILVSHLPTARHIINGSLDSIIYLIRSVQTLQILSHISHTTLLSVSHITEREGHITYAQEYLVFTSHVLSRFSKSLSSLLRSHVHSFLHISCFHFASK